MKSYNILIILVVFLTILISGCVKSGDIFTDTLSVAKKYGSGVSESSSVTCYKYLKTPYVNNYECSSEISVPFFRVRIPDQYATIQIWNLSISKIDTNIPKYSLEEIKDLESKVFDNHESILTTINDKEIVIQNSKELGEFKTKEGSFHFYCMENLLFHVSINRNALLEGEGRELVTDLIDMCKNYE